MAKPISFNLAGQKLSIELGSKIDKRALYGNAKRIAEKDGQALERGLLLADGSLLPRNAVSSVRVDPDGSPIASIETLIDGKAASLQASSFDDTRDLQPVPLTELLSFATRDVYPITQTDVPAGLYRTEFNYRASYQPHDALVLVRPNTNTAFLLVGVAKQSTLLALQSSYEFFDAQDTEEEADELDFSMV
jgi:hypothetical protein